jgi:DNA polymerase III epsilon subunit-like protein
MKLISIDLEMNQPSRKIIQIGAVCFDPKDGSITEIFNQLVDPGEALNPEITQLTRITDQMLFGKPSIKEAAVTLSAIKNRLQTSPIGIVWGSAESNDVRKIYEEASIESPFVGRIIDVKATFQMLANSSAAEFRSKVGLSKACNLLGIGWDEKFGKPHDALADAYNTMRVYMFLSKCLKGGFDIKRS